MGRPAKNFIGQRIGRVVIVARIESDTKAARYRVRCDCGGERIVVGSKLLDGAVGASCGCLKSEHGRRTAAKHGHATPHNQSGTYWSWIGLRARCLNPSAHGYKDYGGRGIRVCDRWLVSFENFLADMGERPPGMSIDRKDNDGDYTPDNCRWATPREQRANQRTRHDRTAPVCC